MRTPPQRQGSSPHQLELSVVCDDIQLSSSRRTPARKSGGRRVRTGTRSTRLRTRTDDSAKTKVVSVEEPPDAWSITRPLEITERSRSRRLAWSTAVWAGILVRCASPFFNLNSSKVHPDSRPILAPGNFFVLLLAPVILSQVYLGIAGLTSILDNNVAIHSSTSMALVPLVLGFIDCGWTWSMVKLGGSTRPAVTAGFILSLLSLIIALATYSHVLAARKANLAGVWHLQTRLRTRLIDFWLLEVPATFQVSWSAIQVITSYSYYRISKYLESHMVIDLESETQLTEELLTTSTITFGLLILTGAIGYATKKRTSAIPPLMALWVCMDWAEGLRRVTDLSLSPHLAGVDPVTVNNSYSDACIVFIVLFGCMGLLSIVLNVNSSMKRQREAQAADGTYSFIGGKSTMYRPSATMDLMGSARTRPDSSSALSQYVRRPSEFMIMRSESDGSDDEAWETSGAGAPPSENGGTPARLAKGSLISS